MADPRRAITVVPSRDALTSGRGLLLPQYDLPLDYPVPFRFAPGDTSAADGRTTLEPSGGPIGRYLMLAFDDVGDDLTDDDATLQVGDGLCRYIQAGTLSQDIILRLGTINARPGYQLEIVRLDTEPHIVTIEDGFAPGDTLAVMPVSTRSRFVARVNAAGTHWLHRDSHLML